MLDTWVFCCGPVRSGSTLQFNIVREIVEHSNSGQSLKYVYPDQFPEVYDEFKNSEGIKVFKTHSITPIMEKMIRNGEAMGVSCFRDVRDVIVSMHHKSNSPIHTDSDFSEFTKKYIEYQFFLEELPNLYLSKYEIFYCNIHEEVKSISKFLQIELSDQLINKISNELTFSNSQDAVRKAKKEKFIGRNGAEYLIEEKTLLHSNHFRHIHPGAHGNYLSRKNIRSIEKEAYSWLVQRKYPVSLHSKLLNLFGLYN